MIVCHKMFLEQRCEERGYLLADVMGCVVEQNGDIWTINENHAKYPHQKHSAILSPNKPASQGKQESSGPGTELKKLLGMLGIKAKPNCSCNKRAKVMDEKGIEWCEQNIDTISKWLREEATKRKLPYADIAGKMVISLAIRRAKRARKLNA